MLKHRSVLTLVVALGAASALVSATRTEAAPGQVVQYQGRLVDTNGVPREGVIGRVAFRLYSTAAPSSATFVWGEAHASVRVSRGVFTVHLGAGTETLDANGVETAGAHPFTTEFDGTPRYLEVQVEGDAPLAPLSRMGSVPEAVSSHTARAVYDPATSTALDLPALDARYVEAAGDSFALNGDVTGTGKWLATAVDATHGGTGQTSFQPGDLLYAVSPTQLQRLPAGQEGQVLTMRGGVPRWETPTVKRARYVIRQYSGSQFGTLSIPTGFNPRLVIFAGQAGPRVFAVAHSPVGGSVEQMGFQFDHFGNFNSGSGVLVEHFGLVWAVTQMNQAEVRISQPNGLAFVGWIAVFGED